MLTVNPPTAHLLLTSIVDLAPGEWIIQNAANSAVGRYVIQLAKARGIRTVNGSDATGWPNRCISSVQTLSSSTATISPSE